MSLVSSRSTSGSRLNDVDSRPCLRLGRSTIWLCRKASTSFLVPLNVRPAQPDLNLVRSFPTLSLVLEKVSRCRSHTRGTFCLEMHGHLPGSGVRALPNSFAAPMVLALLGFGPRSARPKVGLAKRPLGILDRDVFGSAGSQHPVPPLCLCTHSRSLVQSLFVSSSCTYISRVHLVSPLWYIRPRLSPLSLYDTYSVRFPFVY